MLSLFNSQQALALLLIVLFVLTSNNSQEVSGIKLNRTGRQQNGLRYNDDDKHSTWDKDGNLIINNKFNNEVSVDNDNDDDEVRKAETLLASLETVSNIRESINSIQLDGRPPMKSSNERNFECGRAIGTKKYKDLLTMKELTNKPVKYRPIEMIRMPRIIGGDPTEPGEFPWTVSVKLNDQPICGGSLIDKSWILTAAHCVVGYNPKNLTIRLGAYRIKDLSEKQTIDLPVSMFIVHKEYSMPRPFSNDIALVKLNESVELSDFIIPICLPTEDQVSTSTSSMIVNDYTSNNGGSSSSSSSSSSSAPAATLMKTDEDGVVISTKMSDYDIAKCFNKLEQNYLNSIGLGSIGNDATTEQSTLNEIVTTISSTLSSSNSNSNLNLNSNKNLFSYGNPLDKTHQIYALPSDEERENEIVIQQNNKIKFNQQNKLAHNYATNNNQYIYYPSQFPWQSKSDQMIRFPYFQQNNQANKFPNPANPRWDNKIKLSRLPISKELLREIQSVGSGSMPSLNLDFQQDNFVSMASNLAQASGGGGGGGGGGSLGSPSSPAASPASATTSGSRFDSIRRNHLIRTSSINDIVEEEEKLEDDPTKYSGLSGTVVGWGWVREIDGEDPISSNNKGYPSVTLQKVKLPILRNNVCEAWFQSQSKKITLLPSQFCAGFNSGGKDACRGDSGGPMVIEDNSDTGRYKLIGIVSAGIGCARPSLPGLYTRVASFIPWINAQLLRY